MLLNINIGFFRIGRQEGDLIRKEVIDGTLESWVRVICISNHKEDI